MSTLARIILLVLALTAIAACQEPPALDGPHRPLHDDLLDHVVGSSKLTGTIMGRPAHRDFDAAWVLNHQFLRMRQSGPPDYEAIVFVGYDNTSERYVAHWVDVYGGRFSETLGYGTRTGNSIRFVFEYPDGPFRNTFTWKPETRAWQFVLESKNKQGQWVNFAVEDLARAER